jgi:hypothetical protein
MSTSAQGPWRGQGPTLDAAFADAWNNARRGGAQPDMEYKIEIAIMGNNPIHTYVVVINPNP